MHPIASTLCSGLGLYLVFAASNLVGVATAMNAQLVPASFNSTAYNQLISCAGGVSKDFDVAIDDGVVVIIPSEDYSSINVQEEDHALVDCLHAISLGLNAAIDSDRSLVTEGVPWQSLDNANAHWAESNGVEGLQLIPASNTTRAQAGSSTDIQERSIIEERARARYYFALGSYETDCSSYDSKGAVFNDCITHMSAYRSIRFHNVGTSGWITVSFWPHHDCGNAYPYAQRGMRTILIPAATTSPCQRRNTYSYSAENRKYCYLEC